MKQSSSIPNIILPTTILFWMGIAMISNVGRFSRSGPSLVTALLSSNARPKIRQNVHQLQSRKRPRSFSRVFHNNEHHQRKFYSSTTEPEKSTPLSPRQKIIQRFDNDQPATESTELQQVQRKALVDTLDWLENVVIGYNLCPFAEAPMLREELTIQVVMGTNQTEILAEVLGESLRLKSRPGTSLVVCPDLCPNNFLAFLEVYNVLVEGVLPDQELQDDLQIAPFHPLFVFGDDGDDDDDDVEENDDNQDSIGHYTNRSPYPTFHVLRETEVEKAVDALDGNAETVWRRNVDFLEAMEDLFAPSNDSSSNELLRSVFLKGKAHEATQSKNYPFAKHSETIQSYHQEIRTLLRVFRKKDY